MCKGFQVVPIFPCYMKPSFLIKAMGELSGNLAHDSAIGRADLAGKFSFPECVCGIK